MFGSIERTMSIREAWDYLACFGGVGGAPLAERDLAFIKTRAVGEVGSEDHLRRAIKIGCERLRSRRTPPYALIRRMYEALGEPEPAPKQPSAAELLDALRAERAKNHEMALKRMAKAEEKARRRRTP